MKAITLTALTLALVSVACQEATTAPQITAGPELRYAFDYPPPPPSDTGAVAYEEGQSTYFTLQVTYFLNPAGNAGYLKFDNSQDGSTEVDQNAQVRYSQGTFSGMGFVTIAEPSGSELVIDLSTVTQESSFSSCSAPVSAPSATADSQPEGGCFSLTFSGVTRDGIATSTRFVLVPGCASERGIVPCVRPPDPTDPT